MTTPLRWVDEALDALRAESLLREPVEPLAAPGPWVERGDRRLLNLCSNDYLSLAGSLAEEGTPTGTGASRLIAGDLAELRLLEQELASWLHHERTLLFSSGYAANVGTLSALGEAGTLVVSDALNHASIIDGCRLARGRTVVVPHRQVEAVERALANAPERRRLVVTDGYFSMEGDVAPLAALRTVCDRHDAALVVDEAHALGVLGPEGRGACARAGVEADVLIGTLGKSFGAGGAFVAGSAGLIHWLWNRARSFVFSTGLSPLLAAASRRALVQVRSGERTARLLSNADRLRSRLTAAGLLSRDSEGPILPLLTGTPDRALRLSRRLLDRGILAQAIRPPTVPRETSRLRLTVQAGHTPEDLMQAADEVIQAWA